GIQTYIDSACLRMADLWAGDAVMVLKTGFTIAGIVVDEQENPVAGAAVKLGRYGSAPESSAKSAADGAFECRNVRGGLSHVTVTADGFAPSQINVDVAWQSPPVRIALTKGRPLQLRFLDDSGSALEHTRVQVERDGLEWGGFTDNEGRIEWPSAPRGNLRFFAYKEGYFYSRDNEAQANGQEHTFTLHAALKVTGRVVDAETGQPIPSFATIPAYGGSRPSGDRGSLKRGTAGQFSLTFNELPPPFFVRIEADGYEPTVSKPLDFQSEAASCDVALRREDPRMAVNGVVRLPDGQPAAGAEVALCTPEKGICLGKARFVFSRNSIITNADVAGRFSFTPHRDAHTVVAIHPEGFVRSRVNDSIRTVELKLQPWGRLEGVVRAANQPPGAQDVILTDESYVNYGGAVSLDLSSYSTKTDREGYFKFDQVPPGGFFLYLDPGMGKSFSHKTPVEVQPGETQRVQIG